MEKAAHLQCGNCGNRYTIDKLPVGKIARCVCGLRFKIASPADAIRRTPLSLSFPKIGLSRLEAANSASTTPPPSRVETPKASPPEAEPEPTPHTTNVPETKYLTLRQYRLLEKAERLALVSGFDHLTCLPLIRGVDSHEYQERTALHVLKELGGRALLADEVGLGKTIEAGLILKELFVRGLAKKILVLTPASLTTQWRDELKAKFGITFEIASSGADWKRIPRIIASIDTAKSASNMSTIHSTKWDLLIVDEAHKVKSRQTLNWELVNGIPKKFVLMLSATPFQNNLLELFNLITVLRPGQLYTEREFREKFLRRGDPRTAKDPEALRSLLKQVMVRNRRGEVNVRFTQRIPEVRRMRMLKDERSLYNAATSFCRNYFGILYGGSAGLVAIGYLKQLSSSSFSFRESLVKNILPRASDTKDPSIIRAAEELLHVADAVQSNVKLEALVQSLRSHEDKVLVFTQYRGTQDLIAARLRTETVSFNVFNGSLSAEEKDRAVGGFRNNIRILLCTESGGEGRNLQFCHHLVNYDLPWNPMRVEQRIGRIHRMGQTKDVTITNLSCQDTIEDYILELLEKKLNLFRLVVGEVDGIIGKLKFDEHIAKLFLESKDDRDFASKMQNFGDELEGLRTEYERFKDANDVNLGGLGIRSEQEAAYV